MALRRHFGQETIVDLCQVGIATEKDSEVSLAVLDIVNIATNIIAILLADQLDEKLGPLLELPDVIRVSRSSLQVILLLLPINLALHGCPDTGHESEVGFGNHTRSNLTISARGQARHGRIETSSRRRPGRGRAGIQPNHGLCGRSLVVFRDIHPGGGIQPGIQTHRSRMSSRFGARLLGNISILSDDASGAFQRMVQRIGLNSFFSQVT